MPYICAVQMAGFVFFLHWLDGKLKLHIKIRKFQNESHYFSSNLHKRGNSGILNAQAVMQVMHW